MIVPRLQGSLARTFVVYILLFSTLAALVSTTIQLFFEYRRDLGVMETTAHLIESSHKTTLTQALWAYDLVIVESQLRGITEFPGILSAAIHKEGNVIAQAGQLRPGPQQRSYTFALYHGNGTQPYFLGTLELSFNLSQVYARLRDRVVVILITQTLKATLVSLFILLLFYLVVGRHLTSMAAFARSITMDNLADRLVLDRKPRREKEPDELDQVTSALNSMQETLLRDISRIKAIEADLRFSEEKFAKAFHTAPILMTLSAVEDGRYLEVNEAFVRHTGYSRDQAIGATSIDLGFITPEDRALILRELEHSGRVTNLELTLEKADGSEVICLYSGEIIEVDGRQRLLSIALDITHQRRLEKQLLDSQKIESIGNLAGGIAHDFNNLLFPIIGMSELLLEDLPPGSPEYQNAEEILKAGRRGSELVKQILAFSRQSEHQVLPVRVQAILKEVLKLSRATIPANIDIRTDIQTDCGLVSGNPTQIHQIAMNIITNAYHALEDRGGSIMVRLREVQLPDPGDPEADLEPGRYVCLVISDTGHGMGSDVLDKIFDPYFTTKAQGKGTGLGMAVVHGLVKAHSGEIRIQSQPGRGTAVQIYLPVLQTASGQGPDADAAPLPTGRERILVVDDEAAIVGLERKILERLGYTVTALSSSPAALDAFRENPQGFDLVISDMNMPQMTGDQLTRELKAIRPEIPVIICTGFSERISEGMAASLGISGILMKPVVRSRLAAMLRKVLDGKQTS